MAMPLLDRVWTHDDLEALPDDGNRYEIIDGELFVTPAPVWDHQDAVGWLYRRLVKYLGFQRIGHAMVSPADIVFSPKRVVQPDVFVAPLIDGKRPRAWTDIKGLVLAIEVMSPSTARADRVFKRALFRKEGVAEYWIVDLDSRTIERSTPADSRVDAYDERLEWLPAGATEPLVLDLVEFFSQVLDD